MKKTCDLLFKVAKNCPYLSKAKAKSLSFSENIGQFSYENGLLKLLNAFKCF